MINLIDDSNIPRNLPLSDEIEAINRANTSIAEHGTIAHDSIDWD